MPLKLKRQFEREYTKKGMSKAEADRIFYSWENLHKHHYPKRVHPNSQLVLQGSRQYTRRMFNHLKKEHPSTRRRMRLI